MWKQIFDKLEEKGLNPYPPGMHEGLCTERYCVVKENSQVPFSSPRTGYRLIDIIVFVPLVDYMQVGSYVAEIKAALEELPFLRRIGNETPVIIDDEVKAYTTSIEYQILKKLEG